ncbi:MAG: hypothetical protein JW728_05500 [Candidatus Aureabacteria bacterium]|nr:hypothetical protein [Candidatus Auribacterota bacterium]
MRLFYIICLVVGVLFPRFAGGQEVNTIRSLYDDEINSVGRYKYSYPARSDSRIIETADERYSGVYALEITLDFKDFSGVAVGNFPPVDLDKYRFAGALEFRVKGCSGSEKILVALLDLSAGGDRKTETVVKLAKYLKMSRDWQKVIIPISDFPETGQYWDGERMIHHPVDWSRITEIKFAVEPYYNEETIKFFVDDIKLVKTFGLL